jgi:Bardet-Biedl syndrome 1 protein
MSSLSTVCFISLKRVLATVPGRRVFSVSVKPATVTALEVMRVARQVLLAVALSSGHVRVYLHDDKALLHTLKAPDVVRAMRFGRFGREDHALALVTRPGSVLVKMLQRAASLEPTAASMAARSELVPLAGLAARSPLASGQASAAAMHVSFQRDLVKLKLTAAQAYVDLLTQGELADAQGDLGGGSRAAAVRLQAEVAGLGPAFLVKVNVQNGGLDALRGGAVAVAYDPILYRVAPALTGLPLLLPGASHSLTLHVHCVDETAPPAAIKLLVVNSKSQIPFASAVVSMPQSELLE